MKAALLYGKGDLRIEDIEKPTIGKNEILVRVKSAFICGTDIRMFKNGHKNVPKDVPLILGHEFSGVIEEVGANVKGYKEGMRVTVAPNMGCGTCKMCISGNTHLCSDYKALGISLNGAFAEYVRVPEPAVRQGNVFKIGDNVSFGEAALIEPLSCVYNGFERCDIRPGDKVLIIGAGPIGIMHAKLAKMGGASEIFINDLSDERLDLCRCIDRTFKTISSSDLKEQIMSATNGDGVDVCITACSAPEAQRISLELMAINGRVLFFGGLQSGTIVNLDTNLIHYKQLLVTGTTRSSLRQYKKTLDIISSGRLNVRDIITSSVTINDFKQAFLQSSKGIGLKTMLTFEPLDRRAKFQVEAVEQRDKISRPISLIKEKETPF
mgnify:CR=1 FL=1